jgi:hypothetical protein
MLYAQVAVVERRAETYAKLGCSENAIPRMRHRPGHMQQMQWLAARIHEMHQVNLQMQAQILNMAVHGSQGGRAPVEASAYGNDIPDHAGRANKEISGSETYG